MPKAKEVSIEDVIEKLEALTLKLDGASQMIRKITRQLKNSPVPEPPKVV